ncbi:unnamed protein product [Ceutorhynchus assimilis]|uniref:Uncharacterized protein n=1 Tax=Ceutorhynchus assimilis TaxID=467358 RepID=A0A9P0DD58_9CUCU|nr:unnamed protein product [Ceutorhynchus assimilis]
MGLPFLLLVLLLIQSALSVTDDAYQSYVLLDPDDDSDLETYLDRQMRSGDKFLRFGKNLWDYEAGNEVPPYEDRDADRPSRTGRQAKNDDFLRFGRSKPDLRLTEDPQQRSSRSKTSFLRFGRSIKEESKNNREKREASSGSEALKRHENYLRFGRNSNFMRFGRNLGVPPSTHRLFEEEMMKQHLDSRNKHMIDYLKNLMRQSEEINNRH